MCRTSIQRRTSPKKWWRAYNSFIPFRRDAQRSANLYPCAARRGETIRRKPLMIRRFYPAKRYLVLLAAFFLAVPRLAAEPVPSKDDRMLTQVVCEILKRGHLHKPELTDEVS